MSIAKERARVERLIAESVEQLLVDICAEDGMRPSARDLANLRDGIIGSGNEHPITDDGVARLGALTDEQIKLGVRLELEPMVRQALAPERPS